MARHCAILYYSLVLEGTTRYAVDLFLFIYFFIFVYRTQYKSDFELFFLIFFYEDNFYFNADRKISILFATL